MKSHLRPRCSLLKGQGEMPLSCPHSPASLRVTEQFTIITNILNAVAHFQLKFCESSKDLFKHPTNNNNHNYLQNHIISFSTWSLSSHQRSDNFLRSVVVTTNNILLRFITAVKAYAVACTVNAGFPSIVTQLYNESEVGKFATVAIWKHCDAIVSQNTYGHWLLETQAMPLKHHQGS